MAAPSAAFYHKCGFRNTASSRQMTGRHSSCCAVPRRREAITVAISTFLTLGTCNEAHSGILTKTRPKKVPIEEYSTLPSGLLYYDIEGGFGDPVSKGDNVKVHYDCLLGKVNVASSRASALLVKNEVVPEPFSFVAGRPVFERRVRRSDGSSGNIVDTGGPKPPPALSTAVLGMKRGGKRSVIVTPDQGYGDNGYGEVPGGATVELLVEILDFKQA